MHTSLDEIILAQIVHALRLSVDPRNKLVESKLHMDKSEKQTAVLAASKHTHKSFVPKATKFLLVVSSESGDDLIKDHIT